MIVQRALLALGFAAFRVAEDQVDIRGQVQLVATEFAHAEDHHVLRLAAPGTDGHPMLLAMARVQPLVGQVDAGIGQVGQIAAGFGEARLARQVAPDDPHLLAVAKTSQGTLQPRFVVAVGQFAVQQRTHLTEVQRALQQPRLDQPQQHLRISANLFDHEVAGRADPAKGFTALGRPSVIAFKRLLRQIAQCAEEHLFGTTDQRQKRRRHCNQRWQTHDKFLKRRERLSQQRYRPVQSVGREQ